MDVEHFWMMVRSVVWQSLFLVEVMKKLVGIKKIKEPGYHSVWGNISMYIEMPLCKGEWLKWMERLWAWYQPPWERKEHDLRSGIYWQQQHLDWMIFPDKVTLKGGKVTEWWENLDVAKGRKKFSDSSSLTCGGAEEKVHPALGKWWEMQCLSVQSWFSLNTRGWKEHKAERWRKICW